MSQRRARPPPAAQHGTKLRQDCPRCAAQGIRQGGGILGCLAQLKSLAQPPVQGRPCVGIAWWGGQGFYFL